MVAQLLHQSANTSGHDHAELIAGHPHDHDIVYPNHCGPGHLRQALGTMQTPSNQILIGLALFTSMFIMSPVFEAAYSGALSLIWQKKLALMKRPKRVGAVS